MTGTVIGGTVLHPGSAMGNMLCLDEPVSFWGGIDPTTGRIVDRSHPQAGECLADRIVAIPGSRGSSGTPGVLGEALRLGVGPAALVVTKPDINLVAGAAVAQALYGIVCPVVLVTAEQFAELRTGVAARI